LTNGPRSPGRSSNFPRPWAFSFPSGTLLVEDRSYHEGEVDEEAREVGSGAILMTRRNYGTGSLFTERGKWYGQWRVGGRQVKRAIGPKRQPGSREGLTRRQAEAELRRKMETSRPAPRTDGVSFEDAAREYLRFVGDVRKIDLKTLSDYRGVIDGYLIDEFGALSLDAVTPDLIDAYKERLIAEGRLSNRTIVRHLTVLHGVFKRAKRVWGLAENPAAADMVERPKVTYTGEFDTFDADEVELLAAHADDPQDAAIYRVAAYSGLRQGELLALRWSDVDFFGGLLHVRRNFTGGHEKVPKGKRVRSVPMTPTVIDALAQLKERDRFIADDDLVFTREGEHLNHFDLRSRYYAALERAGLRRLRFHDLRHAFGSAAITELDPHAVQSYMGHQHYSTTQRYLHHKPQRDDAAKLAKAFGARTNSRTNLSATEDNSEQEDVPEQG
jgi:integrase